MMSAISRQRGLSLIELLIAMLLGLILTAGALGMMLASRNLNRTTDTQSRIQENGRFAIEFLNQGVSKAGYLTELRDDASNSIFLNCASAQCTKDGTGTNSDQIAVALDPEDDVDCVGNTVGLNDIIANVYTVVDLDGDNVSSLYCRGYNIDTNSWLGTGPQPLVDGVQNMQIHYGINDDIAVVRRTKQYISADSVTNWSAINTARIALLVNSGQPNGTGDTEAQSFDLLDVSGISCADHHDCQVYITTITLNNVIYKNAAR